MTIYIYDAGLPHPPSPHPMVSPLACQVGSCLVWPCCFPVWSCLASSPPLWSGACCLFGWPRSSLPPPVGWGLWSFWLAPPRLVWLLPLVSSNVIARCSLPDRQGCCSFLANGAPVPALMRLSAPVKKHWLGSFSIVLPPSGLRGLVPVVRDRWEQGRPGPGGRGGGGGRGDGGPGPESIYHISTGGCLTMHAKVCQGNKNCSCSIDWHPPFPVCLSLGLPVTCGPSIEF